MLKSATFCIAVAVRNMILMYEKCNVSVALWLFTDSKECSLKFAMGAGVETLTFTYYFNVNIQDSIYKF